MCIVIDINTLPSVFDTKSLHHQKFKPVLDWIVSGKGKIVYGGTKYKEELAKAHKFLGIFRNFAAARKIVPICDHDVDLSEHKLKSKCTDSDFDDPHIIAIVVVSKCKLVCSSDARSYKFIKDPSMYTQPSDRPSIYSNLANKTLLEDNNIADICQPSTKLAKKDRNCLTAKLI